jgi:cbb3-type cytochrome oxidase maturation protein
MNIIYVLIPLSVVLMVLAIAFFFWAVRNDQFDDLDTPALDILDDEDEQAGKADARGSQDQRP